MEIQYLFVNKFKWFDTGMTDDFDGHPREGAVYRSIYNADTKLRDVEIFPGKNIVIQSIQLEGEEFNYNSDLIPLNRENILLYPVKEEDLSKILIWDENGNRDMLDKFERSRSGPQIDVVPVIVQAMMQQEEEEMQTLQDALDSMAEVHNLNFLHVPIITELCEYLKTESLMTEDDPAHFLEIDEKKGLSINIGRTMRALKQYAGDNRRTNESREDLFEAMLGIMAELYRRDINEMD